jgi:hypothetical protein
MYFFMTDDLTSIVAGPRLPHTGHDTDRGSNQTALPNARVVLCAKNPY